MIQKIFKKLINKNKKENQEQELFDGLIKTEAECPICGNVILERDGHWCCVGVISGTCNFNMSRYRDGRKMHISVLSKYLEIDDRAHVMAVVKGAMLAKDTNNQTNQNQEIQNTQIAQEAQEVQETQEVQVIKEVQEAEEAEEVEEVQEVEEIEETEEVQETQKNKKNSKQYSKKTSTDDERFFKNRRELKYQCSCGNTVYRYGNLAKCSNPDCGFKIRTNYHGKNFSDEQIAELIANRVSKIYTFKNSSTNEPFKGRVFIDFDDDYNLIPKYKFVSDLNTLSEKYKNRLFAPDEGDNTEIPLSTLLKKTSTKKSEDISNNNSKESKKDNLSKNDSYNQSYKNKDYDINYNYGSHYNYKKKNCDNLTDYYEKYSNNVNSQNKDNFYEDSQQQKDEIYNQFLEQDEINRMNNEIDEYELYKRINETAEPF